MNVYGLVLVAALMLAAVEARPHRFLFGGGITWYCKTWGFGCPKNHQCVPILIQKDTGAIVINADDTHSAVAVALCQKFGLGCCKSDDTPDIPEIGTPCDLLARATNAVYAYAPRMAGVIRKEIRKLEKHLGFSFSDRQRLKDLACAVAEAKNLKELGKALHVSQRKLKAHKHRLQRRAKLNCDRFVLGMSTLHSVDPTNTFTRQAYYAISHLCELLNKYGIFTMAD